MILIFTVYLIWLIVVIAFIGDSILLLETLLRVSAWPELPPHFIYWSYLYFDSRSCLDSDSIHRLVDLIETFLVPFSAADFLELKELWHSWQMLCWLKSLRWWWFLVMELDYAWIDFQSVSSVLELLKRSCPELRLVHHFCLYALEMSGFGLLTRCCIGLGDCLLLVACLKGCPWCVKLNLFCISYYHPQRVVDSKVHQARQERALMPMVPHLHYQQHHRGLDVNCSWALEIVWCFARRN